MNANTVHDISHVKTIRQCVNTHRHISKRFASSPWLSHESFHCQTTLNNSKCSTHFTSSQKCYLSYRPDRIASVSISISNWKSNCSVITVIPATSKQFSKVVFCRRTKKMSHTHTHTHTHTDTHRHVPTRTYTERIDVEAMARPLADRSTEWG